MLCFSSSGLRVGKDVVAPERVDGPEEVAPERIKHWKAGESDDSLPSARLSPFNPVTTTLRACRRPC